jgi:hypothetical protein
MLPTLMAVTHNSFIRRRFQTPDDSVTTIGLVTKGNDRSQKSMHRTGATVTDPKLENLACCRVPCCKYVQIHGNIKGLQSLREKSDPDLTPDK